MILASTDWSQTVTAAFTFLTALLTAWVAFRQRQQESDLRITKKVVEEVKASNNVIVTRTNSLAGIAADTIASQAKILASIPGASAADVEAAARTAKIAADHKSAQIREDAMTAAQNEVKSKP